MLESLYASLSSWVIALGSIGVLIILLLAVFHVTFEGPLALFLMTTLTILLDSLPLAVLLLLMAHILGLPIFYFLVHSLNRWSQAAVEKAKLTKSILDWVEHQPEWKHMIVVGLPFVYTYPIKVAYTLRSPSFGSYLRVLMGSYGVLYIGNVLIYYGVLSFFTTSIPSVISFILMSILIVLIYFGKKWINEILHPQKSNSH